MPMQLQNIIDDAVVGCDVNQVSAYLTEEAHITCQALSSGAKPKFTKAKGQTS